MREWRKRRAILAYSHSGLPSGQYTRDRTGSATLLGPQDRAWAVSSLSAPEPVDTLRFTMKPRTLFLLVGTLVSLTVSGLAREIRIPAEGALFGNVLIAEAFVETIGRGEEETPIEFQVWPFERGLRPSTWFQSRIEAHPGDVITIAPGFYDAEVWIFVDGVTIRTDPEAEDLAWIRGTVEIDADGVVLERIGVTNSTDPHDSGHGFEVHRGNVNRITFRGCRSERNRWTGIHMIGASGTILELRVEDCWLADNGMDGMDSTSTQRLVVTGCTITGNGWDQANGVGVRIGHNVEQIELVGNTIEGNRSADVYYVE